MPVKKVRRVKKVVKAAEEKVQETAATETATAVEEAPEKTTVKKTTVKTTKKVEAPKASTEKTPASKTKTAAPKASAKKAESTGGGRITLGNRRRSTQFQINEGGRTTRDTLIHMFFERMAEKGLALESKKLAAEVLDTVEEVVMEITDKSNLKWLGGMFRLRNRAARAYSLPTTEKDTFVPAHREVTFRRYAGGGVETIQGKIIEDGLFLPDGEEEPIEVPGATPRSGNMKAPVRRRASAVEEDDDIEDEELEEEENFDEEDED